MFFQSLQKVGFTEGEIRVYTALLELGESSTGPIIKKSQITGSKVYEILEKLKEKGLVSYVTKEKTKYFQVSPPNRILDFIEKTEAEIQKNKNEIKSLLPQLEAKQKSLQLSQSAQVFEGWEGLRTVFKLIIDETKHGGTYYAFAVGEELQSESVINFLRNHHQRRIQENVKVNLILNPTDKKYIPDWDYKGLELKFYEFTLPVGVFIFGDYVANITFSHKTAFLIKSQYVANNYKRFFEDTWKKAKKD